MKNKKSTQEDINVSESDMQESSVFIHGSDSSKQVKIIDKSKRAFEISNQSTQALELSLMKDRSSCKFKYQKCMGWIYAFWSLLFKHHGLPPKKGSRYPYFLAFAVFIALDFLLTTVTCFHIFSPAFNF